jgi:prevent-host-death family protein
VREVQLRDAKAGLSGVVDDAMRGEPSLITRRGRPAAVVLGYEEWQRLSRMPSFGRLLVSLPLEDEALLERDDTPLAASDP